MIIDGQGIVIVLITGEVDLRKASFTAKIYKELKGFCCQMASAEFLLDIQLA